MEPTQMAVSGAGSSRPRAVRDKPLTLLVAGLFAMMTALDS
jgi:hypothetical protein